MTRVVLVLGIVLGMGSLPASAAPAGAATTRHRSEAAAEVTQRLTGAATEAVAGRVGDHRSVGEMLGSVRDHRDTGAWIDAVAAALQSRTGTPVTTTTSESVEEEPCCEEGPPLTGSIADAVPAGDLDGDGAPDLVAYHHDLTTETVLLEARRGVDAAPRWERTEGSDASLAAPLLTDLDGDGGDDLLALSLDILSEEAEWVCEGEGDEEWCWTDSYHATYRWDLSALSGRDGSRLWSRSYDGELTESYEDSYETTAEVIQTDEFAYEFKATNVAVLPLLVERGSGDAMLVNVFDVEERDSGSGTFVYPFVAGAGVFDGTYVLNVATDVELVNGDGQSGGTFSERSPGMYPLMYPIAQPGGDDLVWERLIVPADDYQCVFVDVYVTGGGRCATAEAEPSLRLEVLDGQTTDQVWTKDFAGWGFSFPVEGDLDADDTNDLAILSEGIDDWKTSFVTGAAGTTLWSADALDFVAVGPLDTTAGDDLITVAFSYEETPPLPPEEEASYTETMTLERRNGKTGAAYLSESWSGSSSDSENGYTQTFPYAAGGEDGNGDGAPDITVGLITYSETFDGEGWSFEIEPSQGQAQSGATAATLYEAPEGKALWPAEDFDGDGLADLEQTRWGYGAVGETGSLEAVRMVDGQGLWASQGTGAYVGFNRAGDLDGDEGADVLRHVDTWDNGRVSTGVTLISGRTGSEGWAFSSRP